MDLKSISGAAVVAMLLAIPGHTARANVYSCDNDRNASQYPNCSNSRLPASNTASSGWSYRSGFAADANGDDRLSYSSDASNFPEYFWNFSGLNNGSIRLEAWLANDAFTDPAADYQVRVAPGTSDGVFRIVNQNAAPSGWNTIVQTAVSSAPIIGVKPSAVGAHAGADIIRITTGVALSSLTPAASSEDELDPASCGAAAAMDASVSAIQQRMLNAIDHYRDVNGSYRIFFQNNAQDDLVTFEISETVPGSHVTTMSRSGQVKEHVSDGTQRTMLDRASGARRVGRVSTASSPIAPRQYFNASCEPVFLHRQDPAAADAASDVAHPQNYAFWLAESAARVVGSDRMLGRKATVIEGHHADYLATKLGATAFQMWVDDETGTLLRLTGSDAHGAVVYVIEVQAIEFNAGVDRRHFAIPAATGAAELVR